MVAGRWADGAARDVYADYNELTLRVTLGALFGASLEPEQEREITGGSGTSGGDRVGEWVGGRVGGWVGGQTSGRAGGQARSPARTSTHPSAPPPARVDAIRVAFEFFARRGATAFIIPGASRAAGSCQQQRSVCGGGGGRRESATAAAPPQPHACDPPPCCTEFVPTPDNLQFSAAVGRLDKAVYSLITQRRRRAGVQEGGGGGGGGAAGATTPQAPELRLTRRRPGCPSRPRHPRLPPGSLKHSSSSSSSSSRGSTSRGSTSRGSRRQQHTAAAQARCWMLCCWRGTRRGAAWGTWRCVTSS